MDSLTSRKLIAACVGLIAIVVVAVVNAWQPIGNFSDVLKALTGITSLVIIGQAWLDYQGKGPPPTLPSRFRHREE